MRIKVCPDCNTHNSLESTHCKLCNAYLYLSTIEIVPDEVVPPPVPPTELSLALERFVGRDVMLKVTAFELCLANIITVSIAILGWSNHLNLTKLIIAVAVVTVCYLIGLFSSFGEKNPWGDLFTSWGVGDWALFLFPALVVYSLVAGISRNIILRNVCHVARISDTWIPYVFDNHG